MERRKREREEGKETDDQRGKRGLKSKVMMTAAGCALGTRPNGCDDMQANADERGM